MMKDEKEIRKRLEFNRKREKLYKDRNWRMMEPYRAAVRELEWVLGIEGEEEE